MGNYWLAFLENNAFECAKYLMKKVSLLYIAAFVPKLKVYFDILKSTNEILKFKINMTLYNNFICLY